MFDTGCTFIDALKFVGRTRRRMSFWTLVLVKGLWWLMAKRVEPWKMSLLVHLHDTQLFMPMLLDFLCDGQVTLKPYLGKCLLQGVKNMSSFRRLELMAIGEQVSQGIFLLCCTGVDISASFSPTVEFTTWSWDRCWKSILTIDETTESWSGVTAGTSHCNGAYSTDAKRGCYWTI